MMPKSGSHVARHLFCFAMGILLLSAFGGGTLAQTNSATLGGTVSDSSGALIPGVTITATNIGTNIVTSVVSNDSGTYQFASLQSGTYKLSAQLPSFQIQTYDNVALDAFQQVRLNF